MELQRFGMFVCPSTYNTNNFNDN